MVAIGILVQNGDALFELPKPDGVGVGFDSLPSMMKSSNILSANNLGAMAMINEIPSSKDVQEFMKTAEVIEGSMEDLEIYERAGDHSKMLSVALHLIKSNTKNPSEIIERVVKICADKKKSKPLGSCGNLAKFFNPKDSSNTHHTPF